MGRVTAAILPMMLVGHFQSLLWSHDEMALAAVSLYLFVRFGVTNIIRKYTVHRGMFHSIPACLIFAGLAFLICGTAPTIQIRCYKAGGVALGEDRPVAVERVHAALRPNGVGPEQRVVAGSGRKQGTAQGEHRGLLVRIVPRRKGYSRLHVK